jgi:hydroxyacylglutathione hydrolase
MPFEIVTIPCLSDNYAWLIRETQSGAVAVVDVPEAGPVQQALSRHGWSLSHILITHHHYDHIDGVEELRAATGAKVVGAAADAHRLPPLDTAVSEGDDFALGAEPCAILDVSGHTVGHIAYHFKDAGAVFTADSLMTLGCGRVFEGTFEMMWDSLQKFLNLDADTMIYSGHEYTASNAAFALSIEPQNADLVARSKDIADKRARDLPTVPSSLKLELATNPFLRAHLPEMKAQLGMQHATDAAVFAEIRTRKDNF